MTAPYRILLTSLLLFTSAGLSWAGSLDAPAPPSSSAGAMYTSGDLYHRLTTGAAGAKRSGPFAEPTAAPGPTGYTSDELMAAMPAADNAAGAIVGQVLAGRSFWGLRTDGTWGLKVGTMPPQALNPASTAVPAGYYAATNLTTVDPDLTSANIRAGVTLFGVGGKAEVVDTTEAGAPAAAGQILAGRKAFVNGVAVTGTIGTGANVTGANGALTIPIPDGMYTGGKSATATDANLVPGNIKYGATIFGVSGAAPPAPVAKTGQTICYDAGGTVIDCAGTGQDGAWRKGVSSPNPRFTDNNNGTVTDNATGLIWAKNANCFGAVNWETALSSVNSLSQGYCGLLDGSIAGQWRVPNFRELTSLIDYGKSNPALTDNPFSNLQYNKEYPNNTRWYWSSSSLVDAKQYAWIVDLCYGVNSHAGLKTTPAAVYVLPVRGGQ